MDRECHRPQCRHQRHEPARRRAPGRSLGNRPSLGYPGDKYEMGMEYAEEIEVIAEDLVKQLFSAPYAEIRVGSGALANLYSFMATAKPGDRIMAFTRRDGRACDPPSGRRRRAVRARDPSGAL